MTVLKETDNEKIVSFKKMMGQLDTLLHGKMKIILTE